MRGKVPKDVHKMVKSSTPVLLMSGERDPVTPPAFGDRVAKGLGHSKHVVFPHASHGNFGVCGNRMVAAFFDAGKVEGLDTACLSF